MPFDSSLDSRVFLELQACKRDLSAAITRAETAEGKLAPILPAREAANV